MTHEQPSTDRVVRAITEDGSLRILAIATVDTVQGVLDAQGLSGDECAIVGELVTGAALLREAMAPDDRLQIVVKHPVYGSLTADTHGGGMTRALAQLPLDTPMPLGPETLLTVIRAMPNGELHQGVIETADEGGISAAMMSYLQNSEQVHTVVAVGTVIEEGQVLYSGGYLVQLLPNADIETLRAITERLERLEPLETLFERTLCAPAVLLDQVLGPIPYRQLADGPVFFGCNCSEDRVLGALSTLSATDIEDLFEEDEAVSINCDYCSRSYDISLDQLT